MGLTRSLLMLLKTLNVGKLSQTIAFSPITDKSIGDFDFDPGAQQVRPCR